MAGNKEDFTTNTLTNAFQDTSISSPVNPMQAVDSAAHSVQMCTKLITANTTTVRSTNNKPLNSVDMLE